MTLSQLESIRAARLQLLDHGDTQAASLLNWAVTAEPEGWRPIDTAPKDGTVVSAIIPDSDIPQAVRFNELRNGWEMVWDGYCLKGLDTPTHWMPLPQPPAV